MSRSHTQNKTSGHMLLCLFHSSWFGLTAVVLVAAVSTVVPAVTVQRRVDAQVVGALEPSGTR